MAEPTRPHRVVVVGAGFGGLFATRSLRRADEVAVTVVERTNHHLFQPLLYQVATGILSEGEVAPAVRDVLRRQRNAEVVMGHVTGFDPSARTLAVHQPQTGRDLTVPYDSLIVATGVETSYFGHDEFAAHAPGMKSIDDALELRGRIFGAFEAAETVGADERDEWLTFVVVGGGPTGVEMAGQIAELSRRSLRRNFRAIDPAAARVLLFEGGDALLGAFGPRLSRLTERDLTRHLGIEVHLKAMVTAVDEHGVDVRLGDGTTRRFGARTVIWAAGMKASDLGGLVARATGTETDRAGRLRVAPDCSLPGHPEIFVVGDLMALDDLPGMAEVAMQSGHHAATTIRRRLNGQEPEPLAYRDLGSMAAISRFRAAARIGPISVGGLVGWFLWLFVHLATLTGFKNRITALFHWAVSFVGRGRAERTITERQVAARLALEPRHPGPPPDDQGPSSLTRASGLR
jgi:NADH dehydrogenase